MPIRWPRIIGISSILLYACACPDPDPGCDISVVHPEHTPADLVAQAKEELAEGNYSEALQLCLRAEEIDDRHIEAKYCVVLASFAGITNVISALAGFAVTQFESAPTYRPEGISVKSSLSAMVDDVEQYNLLIDTRVYQLARYHHPTFTIEDFPVKVLDRQGLELLSRGRASGDISLNLSGTWDKSEVMLFGMASNTLQLVLDYLLAHELRIGNTSAGDLATFLLANPDFLSRDSADEGRLKGDSLYHKGLRKDALSVLSYAVGREEDEEGVAPRNTGLAGAIKLSAASTADDKVIRWIDEDQDGIPEELQARFLGENLNDLKVDGRPFPASASLDNPFREATWRQLTALAIKLRDNIEAGGSGEPVPLVDVLQAIATDLKHNGSTLRLASRRVPDVFALDPAAFLEKPKVLGELLPHVFSFTTAEDPYVETLSFSLEAERYDVPSGERRIAKMGLVGDPQTGDFDHFDYRVPATFAAGATTVEAYQFWEAVPPALLPADGILPDAKRPILFYAAWLDPTFGGLLYGAPRGDGRYAPVDQGGINVTLGRLVRYYCLDFSLESSEVFEDGSYDAGNKIADCTEPY